MGDDGGFVLIFLVVFLVMGGFGAWVASQKHRNEMEGFILGFLFGPLGVLIEVLLPTGAGTARATGSGAKRMRFAVGIDDQFIIDEIARRFTLALEDEDEDWRRLPYRRKRGITARAEPSIRKALGLTPSQFATFAAAARAKLLDAADQGQPS